MMNNKYEYCEKFLENLAKAYTEYNTEYIIHSLANNFHFNSMWFFNETEKYVFEIFGDIDSLKLKSCMTLFNLIAPDDIFNDVLKIFYGGEKDLQTIHLLNLHNEQL